MRFLLAGASGFLGSALRVRLAEQGHEVVRLVRREPATATERRWSPDEGHVPPEAFAGVDVVVQLAGAGVADRLWTEQRRRLILSSRVNTTRTLATALAAVAAGNGGVAPALVQASGVAVYGTQPSETPRDEDAPAADDYLARVVVAWEGAAQPAVDAGVRVVSLRTSPVLDRSGGPLALMRLPWSLGLGAVLGNGRQRMPLVSLHDYLRVLLWAADNPAARGPYNVTVPQPATNAEFTRTLAAELHRPTVLRVPAVVLRTALGELAEQLLGDMPVVPRRLLEEGFVFDGPDVAGAVRLALGRPAR